MQEAEITDALTSASHQQQRWAAFVLLLVVSILSNASGRLEWVLLTALAALAAIQNSGVALIAMRWPHSAAATPSPARIRHIRLLFSVRSGLDLLILLAAIHITGGLFSPLLVVLPVYAILIGLQVGLRGGAIAGLASLLGLAALVLLEISRYLPDLGTGQSLSANSGNPLRSLSVALMCLAAATYMALDSSTRLVSRLRARETGLAKAGEQLAQRVSELDAQREIGQQLAGSLHLDAVLDSIASSALRLVQATDVHLFLYDESTGKFGQGVGVWADGQRKLAISAPREDGLCRAVVRSKAPMLIDDATRHPLYTTPDAKGWGIQSIAGFPVKKGDQVIGVLTAAYTIPHPFADDQRHALLALADQAALAIDNASLYTQVEQHVRELAALYEVSLCLSQSLEPGELMNRVIESLQQIVQAPVGLISLIDEATGEFLLASQRGLPRPVFEEIRSRRLKSGEGFAGHVAASGEPLVTSNAGHDPFNIRASLKEAEQFNLATLPLKTNGRVIGTLQLVRPQVHEFSAADVKLLGAIAQQIASALEKARLYDEAKRRAEELASMREIGLATTSTLDLKAQLRLLHAQVQRILHGDAFFVGLYDEGRHIIDIPFAIEEGWELRELVVPMDAEGLSPWVVRMRRPLRIADLEKERPDLPVQPRHESRPARSWLGVPLIARDRVIGVLSVQSFRPDAFSASDERFLISAAQQVALAIENARLYETMEHRARELTLLNEVSHGISASLDLHEISRRAVSGLADTFGYESVALYRVQGDQLELQAQAGSASSQPRLSLQQGVLGRVVRANQPVFIRDPRSDPDFAGAADVKGEIVVPVRKERQVIGVLDVQDRRREALGDDDVGILGTFGDQIGTAMANAELYKSIQERERFITSLQRVAAAVGSTLDASRILNTLCEEASRFFGIAEAFVWLVEGDDLVGAAASGSKRTLILNLRTRMDAPSPFVVRLIRERRALFVNQPADDRDCDPLLWELFKPAAVLGVPLGADQEFIGALVLVDEENPQRFSTADAEQATALAGQAVPALANARLYAQARMGIVQ